MAFQNLPVLLRQSRDTSKTLSKSDQNIPKTLPRPTQTHNLTPSFFGGVILRLPRPSQDPFLPTTYFYRRRKTSTMIFLALQNLLTPPRLSQESSVVHVGDVLQQCCRKVRKAQGEISFVRKTLAFVLPFSGLFAIVFCWIVR